MQNQYIPRYNKDDIGVDMIYMPQNVILRSITKQNRKKDCGNVSYCFFLPADLSLTSPVFVGVLGSSVAGKSKFHMSPFSVKMGPSNPINYGNVHRIYILSVSAILIEATENKS